jgi:hypothetical protein
MKPILRRLLPLAGLLALAAAGFWFFNRLPRKPAQPQIASPTIPLISQTQSEQAPALDSSRSAPDSPPPERRSQSKPQTDSLTGPSDDPDKTRAWARQDPAGATLWLLHASPGENWDAVLEIVCAEVAQFDPAQAVALAERYSGGNINLLENLVHQWAERNESAAAAYAKAKPPSDLRNRLLGRVAYIQAKTHPAEAAALVTAQIPPGDIQQNAILSVLHQWGQQDPIAAQAWVKTFPAGDLQNRAMREISH